MVYAPVTLGPDQTLKDAKALQERYRITGFPVVDERGVVVGIVTNRDMRFASDDRTPVRAMMTSQNLAMLREPADLGEAKGMMQERRIEKLLVVDEGGRLTGLLTLKDTEQAVLNPLAAKDELGRLRVAAASTVGRRRLRAVGGAGRRRGRRGGDRHGARAFQERRGGGGAAEAAFERGADRRRQRRDRRGDAGADRRRRGRGEGRDRAGLDLHHPDRRRASACRR